MKIRHVMQASKKMHEQPSKVYQLRIWLKEISPMIWRRLLIKNTCTIADFHYCMQIAFKWSDSHLHQFIIYGKVLNDNYLYRSYCLKLKTNHQVNN